MDQRRSLATVLTMAGTHTTVITTRMCPSDAATSQLLRLRRRPLSVVRLDYHRRHKCVVFSCECGVMIYYLFDTEFDGNVSVDFVTLLIVKLTRVFWEILSVINKRLITCSITFKIRPIHVWNEINAAWKSYPHLSVLEKFRTNLTLPTLKLRQFS